MGILKVVIAIAIIGGTEAIATWKDLYEVYVFEIAMAILMAAWILREGW